MWLAVAIFCTALVQDLLLTAWTRAVSKKMVGTASFLSFITSGIAVVLYGSVVNTEDPAIHVFAWAVGSAVGCYIILRYERRIHVSVLRILRWIRSVLPIDFKEEEACNTTPAYSCTSTAVARRLPDPVVLIERPKYRGEQKAKRD